MEAIGMEPIEIEGVYCRPCVAQAIERGLATPEDAAVPCAICALRAAEVCDPERLVVGGRGRRLLVAIVASPIAAAVAALADLRPADPGARALLAAGLHLLRQAEAAARWNSYAARATRRSAARTRRRRHTARGCRHA